jgi:hypothetical protein
MLGKLLQEKFSQVACWPWLQHQMQLADFVVTLSEQEQEQLQKMHEAIEASAQVGRGLQIVMGAADTKYSGWIASDYPLVNMLNASRMAALFKQDSVDAILAEVRQVVFVHTTCTTVLSPMPLPLLSNPVRSIG